MPKKYFWRRAPPFLRVWMTGPPLPPPLSQGLDPVLYTEKEKAGKNFCTLFVLNVAVAGLSFCVFRDC